MHAKVRTNVHTCTQSFSTVHTAIYKEGHILWVCNIVKPNKISVLFTDLIVQVIFTVQQHRAASLIISAQS